MWQRLLIAAFLLAVLTACAGQSQPPVNPDWSTGVEQSSPIMLQPLSSPSVLKSGSYTLNAYLWHGELHLVVIGLGEKAEVTVLRQGSQFKAILEPSLECIGEATVMDKVWRITYLPSGLVFYLQPVGDTLDLGFLARN